MKIPPGFPVELVELLPPGKLAYVVDLFADPPEGVEPAEYALRVGRPLIPTRRALRPRRRRAPGRAPKVRRPRAEVEPVAVKIRDRISELDGLSGVILAGSLRRGRMEIGDVDVVACGERRISSLAVQEGSAVADAEGLKVRVDVTVVEPAGYGAALLYLTGPASFNVSMRAEAKAQGLRLNRYGLFTLAGERIAGRTEEDVFDALGLPFIPPEGRDEGL